MGDILFYGGMNSRNLLNGAFKKWDAISSIIKKCLQNELIDSWNHDMCYIDISNFIQFLGVGLRRRQEGEWLFTG